MYILCQKKKFLKCFWSQYNAIPILSIVKIPKYTVNRERIKVHSVFRIKSGAEQFLLLLSNE